MTLDTLPFYSASEFSESFKRGTDLTSDNQFFVSNSSDGIYWSGGMVVVRTPKVTTPTIVRQPGTETNNKPMALLIPTEGDFSAEVRAIAKAPAAVYSWLLMDKTPVSNSLISQGL